MLTKAGDALEAAFETWNNKRHWNFTRASYGFQTVAPFTVDSCTTTAEGPGVTCASLSTVAAGDLIVGTGIQSGAFVVSVDTGSTPNQLVMSVPATASGTVTLTFYRRDYAAPSDFKFFYNVKDHTNNRIIYPVDSRLHDRLNTSQVGVDAPLFYDPHPMGAAGKMRLLPTPSSRFSLEAKYYRRLTVPSTDGTALDIPIDFEWGIMAEAKAIFLAEKGGYDALAAFWAAKAKEALVLAIATDTKQPDEDAGFLPGYMNVPSTTGDTIAATDPASGWGADWGEDWGD